MPKSGGSRLAVRAETSYEQVFIPVGSPAVCATVLKYAYLRHTQAKKVI
ncbi:unnamed protein product [Callosobruchus maculatus]|uniref:Uncharacterized protein n=1 Tax=Callosobruchus maculatus TaxID=64391 RepID=A0A653CFC3_CALMS|nr:unnamed protein product [Callosobruchus maculatus]